MNPILSSSHPALTLTPALTEYCGQFLKKHNLNYFQVIRVNQDGSTVLLTNRANFTQYCIEYAMQHNVPLIYSCVKKEILDPSSYYFLWEPNLPARPVAMVRNEFDVTNGLTFVERHATHYYMIAFAASHTNHGVLDFYLNNIELLKNFVSQFTDQQRGLMQALESKPLILPKSLQDENLEDMLLQRSSHSRKRIPIVFRGRSSYVTLKEYECLKQLPRGLSTKEIGRVLNISPRTVEQYFERVKTRIGCKSKQDLIQLLH